MTHTGDESRLGKDGLYEKSATNRRRAVVCILAAFAFLIVGLAGGAALFAFKKEWAWVLPMASFGGYLLAFRRGMLLWNPAVGTTWRRCLWLEREAITGNEDNSHASGEDPEKTLNILRSGAPRSPRPGLRLVR